jgi:hypothetical protein
MMIELDERANALRDRIVNVVFVGSCMNRDRD